MKNANGIEFFSLLKCFWRHWRALLSQKHQSGKSEKWSQVRSYLVELHCGFIFNLIILLLAAFAQHYSRKCKFCRRKSCFLVLFNENKFAFENTTHNFLSEIKVGIELRILAKQSFMV